MGKRENEVNGTELLPQIARDWIQKADPTV